MRVNLRSLLRSKRLEIVTGGWVMTDEAAAHYFDMLDQLIEGHQFLRSTLDYRVAPRNSWSIDPFGHGGAFPYLLQQSGIANLYIQRTHFAWKRWLAERRLLEFFWRQPKQNQSAYWEKPLLAHMSPLDLYSYKYACGPHYNTCLEFDFRTILGESSESTAVPLTKENIDSKAKLILEEYSKLGSLFPHNVALVLLGDDFRYNFDIEWQQQYRNYNFLMNHINSNRNRFHNARVEFGTLEDYFRAVEERIPIVRNNYASLQGDFMPYADVYVNEEPNYWTGYYTTRPYFKALSRELQASLRAGEILYTVASNHLRQHVKSPTLITTLERDYALLSTARQNLALFQHHDGITGTSRDYVMEDYGRRMGHSLATMRELTAKWVQYLNLNQANQANNSQVFIYSHWHKQAWSQLSEKRTLRIPADDNGLKLIVFNSHLQTQTVPISIMIDDPFVKVIDVESGSRVAIQINPHYNRGSLLSTKFELQFIDQLTALSLKNYKVLTNEESIEHRVQISLFDNSTTGHSNEAFRFEKTDHIWLENEQVRVDFDRNGLIESIHHKALNQTQPVQMAFIAYHSQPKQSGAYLFRPNPLNPMRQLFTGHSPSIALHRGRLSSTLSVNYTDVSYSLTLYNASQTGAAIELKVLLDLENKDDYNDQEIVIRIQTSIMNRVEKEESRSYRTFYLDSNGFQMIERNFLDQVGVEGNYYPMTTAMYIEDSQNRFTVLSSHSHGATSPEDGAVEIMLDRRIIDDDRRGLSQGVQDNLPVESSFWLLFEHFQPSEVADSALSRLADSLLLQLNYPPVLTYSYKGDSEIRPGGQPYYRNQYLLPPNLLCEYFLLNLRTLPQYNSFGLPSTSSLLILHNRPLTTRRFIPASWYEADCVGPDYPRPHLNRFGSLRLASIQPVTLSGMEPLGNQQSHSFQAIPSSEIASYNVTFV